LPEVRKAAREIRERKKGLVEKWRNHRGKKEPKQN